MVENMAEMNFVKIEGEEDIEITLNDGTSILAQAKSVVKASTDFDNVRAKAKAAMKSLSGNDEMTQDARWQAKFNEVKTFIETNHRNPSKHDPGERIKYYNWLKHNRQLMNAGVLKPEKVELFEKLLALCEENKRVNQYQ